MRIVQIIFYILVVIYLVDIIIFIKTWESFVLLGLILNILLLPFIFIKFVYEKTIFKLILIIRRKKRINSLRR